jgi:DNA-binding FrmR family transcriptional regulator
MEEGKKQEALKRLSYIEGHLSGIRKMVEEDRYCVDVLRQTFAVRRAIEKTGGPHPGQPPPHLCPPGDKGWER